jgi:hypothetical protein
MKENMGILLSVLISVLKRYKKKTTILRLLSAHKYKQGTAIGKGGLLYLWNSRPRRHHWLVFVGRHRRGLSWYRDRNGNETDGYHFFLRL